MFALCGLATVVDDDYGTVTLHQRENLQRITAFSPGDDVYVSLRYYNWSYYDHQVDLPNKFGIDYVVKVRYRKWDR